METGVWDGLVVSYRTLPFLLEALANEVDLQNAVLPIIKRAGDEKRALRMGFPLSRPRRDRLSAREREVYELLIEGRTNKEIATALFISEVTVKVHVRHILQKLGVRTRTEAAVLGATEQLPEESPAH